MIVTANWKHNWAINDYIRKMYVAVIINDQWNWNYSLINCYWQPMIDISIPIQMILTNVGKWWLTDVSPFCTFTVSTFWTAFTFVPFTGFSFTAILDVTHGWIYSPRLWVCATHLLSFTTPAWVWMPLVTLIGVPHDLIYRYRFHVYVSYSWFS